MLFSQSQSLYTQEEVHARLANQQQTDVNLDREISVDSQLNRADHLRVESIVMKVSSNQDCLAVDRRASFDQMSADNRTG
jgi:hypothetical protein